MVDAPQTSYSRKTITGNKDKTTMAKVRPARKNPVKKVGPKRNSKQKDRAPGW